MRISTEQVGIIRSKIDESSINIQTLKDDVLDHLCCVVEVEMERGKSFESALSEALERLAPEGLDSLQNETFYLLNATKIKAMKKVMYLIGLITSISMSLGWTFSILHWPGATELLTYGVLGFGLLFVPLVVVNYFKVNMKGVMVEKLKIIFGSASGLTVALSVVFKLLHLQGADVLLIGACLLFSFGFLPFLFFSMYRKSIA